MSTGHDWQPYGTTRPGVNASLWVCTRCKAEYVDSTKPGPDIAVYAFGTLASFKCEEKILRDVMES